MSYIVEKYNEFMRKEIQSGYRCKTFLITKGNEEHIYQVYLDGNKYQARKKYNIVNFIKDNIEIEEIPDVIEFGECNEYSYLVSEYKEGMEFDKVEERYFNHATFYKSLAGILNKLHSIDAGNKFRLDR